MTKNETHPADMPSNAPADALEEIQQEPIAVIGFAFKYPQDATSTESLWKLLVEARCASTPIPRSGWMLALSIIQTLSATIPYVHHGLAPWQLLTTSTAVQLPQRPFHEGRIGSI